MKSPFLESIRAEIRLRGYSLQTEKTYLTWIKHYIFYIQKQHPASVNAAVEVKGFLSYLATKRHVAVNTQKVALNSLVFMYHKVLHIQLGDLGFSLASKQRQLPIVISTGEVNAILNQLEGRDRLIFELLYGSGLRISECLRLRVQDIDFKRIRPNQPKPQSAFLGIQQETVSGLHNESLAG
jgi:integrase